MPVFDFLRDTKKPEPEKRLEEIDVLKILPNPNQPRATFVEEGIQELADSIAQVGLIQPLVVRPVPSGYELVAGERRLRAVKTLGMKTVICIVQNDVVDEASAMMALIENLQREELSYLEEAGCYSQLLSSFHLTQEELAKKLGKSQSSIANKLRILKLPPAVKDAMVEAGLSERHARALLSLREEKHQLDAVKKIAEKGLSVKETEAYVEKTLNRLYDEKRDGAKPRPIMIRLVKDYRLFMNTVNTAVNQLREAGMSVEVEQSDRPDGVDIAIKVTRKP
ncbi:MAG: ParB/RepB/Spo0J family partition protein [Clostridiaceae bacterium]|nr:ParB/RepB/Spo0J family partition protein [Eubacteriales bacterium]